MPVVVYFGTQRGRLYIAEVKVGFPITYCKHAETMSGKSFGENGILLSSENN